MAFSFCNGTDKDNCPRMACWQYHAHFSCSPRAGFTSGRKKAAAPAAMVRGSTIETIWTAFENATVKQSDAFAVYPVWPSEMMNGITASARDAAIASASVLYYTSQGGIGSRPVLEYSAAVRGGGGIDANSSLTARDRASGGPGCDPTHPATILSDFKTFLQGAQRASFFPRAPGGGTENVGITQAINDMLVQAPNSRFIVFFPVWDKSQDASFRGLLVKGAIEVSATWSAAAQSEHGISLIARKEHRGPVLVACTPGLCSGRDGTDLAPTPKVKVDCVGVSSQPVLTVVPLPMVGKSALSFAAPAGVNCSLITDAL